jgi:hypothetical protein
MHNLKIKFQNKKRESRINVSEGEGEKEERRGRRGRREGSILTLFRIPRGQKFTIYKPQKVTVSSNKEIPPNGITYLFFNPVNNCGLYNDHKLSSLTHLIFGDMFDDLVHNLPASLRYVSN